MKLRNKKTGEIGTPRIDYQELYVDTENGYTYNYKSLQKMCEEWEDVPEEPEEYWTIDWTCTGVTTNKYSGDDVDDFNEAIGNYFATKEEAELAVRKLKAWKRLKDKGFRFDGWEDSVESGNNFICFRLPSGNWETDVGEDLDLLFGGEE